MANKNNILKNVLIISDYDGCYNFTTYYNGVYDDESISTICSTFWDVWQPETSFETLRIKLSEIGITPDYIIVCSDGCIFLEN